MLDLKRLADELDLKEIYHLAWNIEDGVDDNFTFVNENDALSIIQGYEDQQIITEIDADGSIDNFIVDMYSDDILDKFFNGKPNKTHEFCTWNQRKLQKMIEPYWSNDD